jgi:hypothetical protein
MHQISLLNLLWEGFQLTEYRMLGDQQLPIILEPNGSPRFGLGLWNQPAITIPLELLPFAAGVWLYLGSTHAVNRKGVISQ